MKRTDYEDVWREKLSGFEPAVTEADWAAFQQAAGPPPPPSRFVWGYWLIVPLLTAIGLIWWNAAPESKETLPPVVFIAPAATPPSKPEAPRPESYTAPEASEVRTVVRQERSESGATTDITIVPVDTFASRAAPPAVSDLPNRILDQQASSLQEASWLRRIDSLAIAPPKPVRPGQRSYYPPTRIRN